MIQAVLSDAEEKQLTDRVVKMWLDDLRDLAYDVEDILDELATQALERTLVIPACFTSLGLSADTFNANLVSKIKAISSRLDELFELKTELGLEKIAGGTSTAAYRRLPSTSVPMELVVYGREKDKARILEMVLKNEPNDANFGVIPIVGMGGVGKTTLAREVFNDKGVEDFNPRAWVCISDDFDVLRISKAILENAVQVKLKDAMGRRKFLLVLDDIWSKNYELWEALKSPFMACALGSRIIVTTRRVDVALTMEPGGYYGLKLLSDDDCWLVFVKHAFKS
ncbi:hypothetical protein Ddye_027836 [Dipteronia dyeriana]|uniref:Disease resistance RPP13-like protein 1 n=1 Tax=Dipteronia dyeriana TaxID=168575 RepID=A0AAD9TQJ1_9ROSI|nr:hypothetical protein Ddye_027836 [Dipteronia dyeriana]